MTDGSEIAGAIREILLDAWPYRFRPAQLLDDASLGEEGLGLDSIEVVEVVLACEQRCGVELSDAVFRARSLTIGRLVEHLAAA